MEFPQRLSLQAVPIADVEFAKPMRGTDRRMIFTLNFHGLGVPRPDLPPGEADCWIDAEFFAAILEDVAARTDVQVTFDDSNESDYTLALPLLKKRGMSARFFLVAQRIDKKNYLSQRQIQSLVAEGMTVGNHGMRHQQWRGLDDNALREELVTSRDLLEQVTGARVKEAACPYGVYDRRVLQTLRQSGYDTVYTSDGGPTWSDRWIQPRNTIRRSHDLPHVASICRTVPSGTRGLLRDLKLALKRWR